jgi:hypothetical protein
MVSSASTRGGKTWVYWKQIFKKWINRKKNIKLIRTSVYVVKGYSKEVFKMLLKNVGTKQAKTPTTESFRDTSDDVKQARLYLGTSPFLKP